MSRVQCTWRPVRNRVARRLKNWEKRGRGLIERAYSLRVTRMRELVALFSFVITTPPLRNANICGLAPQISSRPTPLFSLFLFFFFFLHLFVGIAGTDFPGEGENSYHQGSRPLRNFTDISTFRRQSSRSERSKVITRGKTRANCGGWLGTRGFAISNRIKPESMRFQGAKNRAARSRCDDSQFSFLQFFLHLGSALFVSIEYSMPLSLIGGFLNSY